MSFTTIFVYNTYLFCIIVPNCICPVNSKYIYVFFIYLFIFKIVFKNTGVYQSLQDGAVFPGIKLACRAYTMHKAYINVHGSWDSRKSKI